MENKQKLGRIITLTAIKTLIAFVIIAFFACLAVYIINPKFAAEVTGNIGWHSAEVNCYELVYARSKSNSDLYNLIVKMDNTKKYVKQNEYIDKLTSNEKYLEFCDNMNASVVEAFNNGRLAKNKISLIYGINEYITSKKVINLIKMGKYEDAFNVATASINTDQSYEVTLYYYVDYLLSDEVSSDVCKNYMQKLLDSSEILENLETRYDAMDTGTDQNVARQIVSAYSKLKIRYTQYVIYKKTNSDMAADAFSAWQTAQIYYNNMIK